MSKRHAPTGFSCPGCSKNFDTETHIPFMGSCGDSVCAVCVNEKRIKTCPVCSRRSFAWKQSNNLAMEMLAATAEMDVSDSKKSKLVVETVNCAPGETVPAILDPKNRTFLAKIVNQLNPTSFIKLASTCKVLHNYCFNCKDVKIIYEIHSISVKMDHVDGFRFGIRETSQYDLKVDHNEAFNSRFLPLGYTGYRYGFLSSAYGRKKCLKYPFEFKLNELVFHEVNRFDDAVFTPLRSLFAEFPIKTVTKVTTWIDPDSHWVFPAVSDVFLQFMKDFRILIVNFNYTQFDDDFSDEALNYLLQNTSSFSADEMNIPEQFLLTASVPNLLVETSISSNTFVNLIKKFADSTDRIRWRLRCDFELIHDALRSFKLLPFEYEGPLPDEHPIIFVKDDDRRKCWLRRKDGKVMECGTDYVSFSMLSPQNYPPCLHRRE